MIPSSALSVAAILHEIEEFGIREIHLTRHGDLTRVRYRIDGLLRTVHGVPAAQHAGLVLRLAAALGENFHLDSFRSLDGDHNVLRQGCAEADDLEALGFGADAVAQIKPELAEGRGLVLVAGTPGSGRTTTLETLSRMVRGDDRRVKSSSGRFDFMPALHSALAGHLVIHEADEGDDLDSALTDESSAHLLSSIPGVVINQRLLRRPCADCSDDEAQACETARGKGCARCRGAGYFGQSLAAVAQPLDEYSGVLSRQALRERALSLVQDKQTTLEEIVRLRL